MYKKQLGVLLLLQALTVAAVLLIFAKIPNIRIAALIAALCFFLLGLVMIKWSWHWRCKWKYFSFWSGHIHMFVFTLPMLLMRVLEWDKNFYEIVWLGVSAAQIHLYSTPFYKLMMIGTLTDLVLSFLQKNGAKR